MTPASEIPDDGISALVQRSANANAALVRGDIDGYLALIEHSQDYVLMAPFGGAPTRGFDTSSEGRAGMSRFFRAGSFNQEVVSSYASRDLAVLVHRAGMRRNWRPRRAGLVATRHSSLPPRSGEVAARA